MKNIIKRGTSLLLVLAMLLSFAAVVGATDATTTTPEKILTLTVENKLLRAGQTEYLAVYEQVAGDYKINALTISATSTNSKVAVKGIYPWIPKSYSGGAWDYDYDTRETVFSSRSVGGDPIAAPPTADPLLVWTSTSGFQTSDKPLCFIKVEAQADVTPVAYQINICRNPHPEKEDDYFLFAYADPVTTEGVSQTEENATLNPGTAVVIPADASLPTVILTQSSFAAPTMATYDPEQGVDLLNYLKIVDKDGNLPNANRALLADAIATSAGAVLGTSTVTTYVESSSGVSAGGRTGLTGLTTAACFVLAIFLMPVLGFVPNAATAPILIIVGVMMASSLKEIEWGDIEVAIPAFFTLIMMPLASSIADGIAFGCISYTVIKLVKGQPKKVHPVMYVISILFLARYIIQVFQ